MKINSITILRFGTLQTILMAVYHFFIPFQFQWKNYLIETSPTINWSLFSLNNYFSFNLLVVAIALAYFIKKHPQQIITIRTLAVIILLFWSFSAVYQFVDPMPLPQHLSYLAILLPAIALLNMLLFIYPIIKLKTLLKE